MTEHKNLIFYRKLLIVSCLYSIFALVPSLTIGDINSPSAWDLFEQSKYAIPIDSPSSFDSEKKPNERVSINQTNGLRLALRRSGILSLRTSSNTLRLVVYKQDLNWQAGKDSLPITLSDTFGQIIFETVIEDDGDENASFIRGSLQTEQFDIPLPSSGLYQITADGSRDQQFFIQTDADSQAYHTPLELIDPSKSIDLFFQAPPETVEITLSTMHFAGLNQTITVFDENDQPVNSVSIDEINKSYILSFKVPTKTRGSRWRLNIPKQDILLQSTHINYWFLSKEDHFDFDQFENLIQPNKLELYAIPGMRIPFRFEIENQQPTPLNLSFIVNAIDHSNWTTIPPKSPQVIPSASRSVVYFSIDVPQDIPLDTTSSFQIDWLDHEKDKILVSSLAVVHVTQAVPLPSSHDHIFLTQERLEQIRQAGRQGADYQRTIYDNLIQWADQIIQDDLKVPEEEGGWFSNYICDGIGDGDDDPDDGTGASLIFDPNRPGFYISPVDGRRYHGRRYERGWLGHYHFEMGSRLKQLGIAYALNPKPEYAKKIRGMLLDYASRYLSWPLDDFQDRPSQRAARILTDTLGEASWLIPAIMAYDFTRLSPHYSPADRTHIELNLIQPVVNIIRKNPMGITNWQSWHNTAIAFAGYLFEDENLLDEALHGRNGHEFLKYNAIRDDGLWNEGSLGYHFFALIPMNLLLESLESHSQHAFDERIQAAYSSVIDVMHPDGRFPALNDASAQPIWRLAFHYEHANAHYNDSRFDETLTFVYDQLGYARNSMEALFFGSGYTPLSLQRQSSLKDKMGLSILRNQQATNPQMALMDYGPHGMIHGHFDKLHLSYFSVGDIWLPDIGTGSVIIPEFAGWFRNTIGHNTIMLGEQYQNEDTEENRSIELYHTTFPELQIMQASFGPPVYPNNSNVRRTIMNIHSGYSVVIDDIQSNVTPFDIIFHGAGDIYSSIPFTFLNDNPWENSLTGYQFLDPPRLFNGSPPPALLTIESSNTVSLRFEKEYGFNDPFENVDDWSGNIALNDTPQQGRHALDWVIVPRPFQSIRKEFQFIEETTIPDRLVFDYKIEASTFARFVLQVNNPPTLNNAQWTITTGDRVPISQWLQADIDLTNPQSSSNHGLSKHVIQFFLTGAENSSNAFHILIDNLRAYRNGEQLPQEKRGLNLLFPGGQPTQYYLASGPSSNPPRTHPVILARRSNLRSTRHISILQPYVRDSTPLEVISQNENTIQFKRGETIQGVEFNPQSLSYAWNSINSNSGLFEFILINTAVNQGKNWAYQANTETSISLKATKLFNDRLILSYHKPEEVNDQMEFTLPAPVEYVFIDQQPVETIDVKMNQLIIYNLPTGHHEIQILLSASTLVEEWYAYQDTYHFLK